MSRIGADGGNVQTLTDRTPRRAIAAIDGRTTFQTGKASRIPSAMIEITSFDDAKIAALSFESGEARVVIEGGTHVRFVPSGHILHARGNGGYVHAFAAWTRIRRENIGSGNRLEVTI